MYRVIIADDEKETRNYIASLVEWSQLKLFLVGETDNGTTLLKMIPQLSPHIVLVDMKMPGIHSTGLIKQLSQLDHPPHVVIISGYDNFEYAQEAIKARVDGYLLKPINSVELNQTLSNIVKELDLDAQIKRNQFIQMASAVDLQKDLEPEYEFVEELDSGKLSPEVLSSFIPFLQNDHNWSLRTCVFCFPNLMEINENLFFGNASLLLYAIKNILDEIFSGKGICCFHQGKSRIVVETAADNEQLSLYLHRAVNLLKETLSLNTHVAVSKTANRVDTLIQNYSAALSLIQQHDLTSDNHILYCKNNVPFIKLDTQWTGPLESAVQYGPAIYLQTLTAVYKNYQEYHLFSARAYELLWHTAYRHLQYFSTCINSEEYDAALSHCNTLVSFSYSHVHIISCLSEISSHISNENISRAEEIRRYIDEHYHQNLTVQALADYFHLSRQHLSRIFKEQTGTSPYNYIIQKKLEQAKILLMKPNIKIAEIVSLLNFSDESHFNRMFKSKTRMTPSAFREQLDISSTEE